MAHPTDLAFVADAIEPSSTVSPVPASIPCAGAEFRVVYPFVKDTYEGYNDGGPVTLPTWRPGVSIESEAYEGEDIWADSEGEMVLAVVGVYKPGRFPTRIFYQRSFIDPDGNQFGKTRLQIATLGKFRHISSHYRLAYDLEETFAQALERRAQGTEAGTAATAKTGAVHDGPVPTGCAQ